MRLAMRIFINQEWNFTIAYPQDWRIIYENEPAGSWIIPIAVASVDAGKGRAVLTVNARRGEILQGRAGLCAHSVSANVTPLKAMGAPQDYIEWNKRELEHLLADYQFISGQETRLADQPAARLIYGYNRQGKRMTEECITLFGAGVTFRFICEAPAGQYVELAPCFRRILDSFGIGQELREKDNDSTLTGGYL
jgi:hypothetical protein